MSKIGRYNGNLNWIAVACDISTRTIYTSLMRTKQAHHTLEAIKAIFKQLPKEPLVVKVDGGSGN